MSEQSPTVGDAGEFHLIDRIRLTLGGGTSPEIIIGIGDDTAVIRIDDKRALVATCDIQVEGTHFRLDAITPYQLGRRAMAVNLSDIAAMGAAPEYALVSMALVPTMPVASFDEILEGMRDECREFDVSIIGGNMARTETQLVVDVFMWGSIELAHLLTRSQAQPGDVVYVTGTLGASAAGIDILDRYGPSCSDEYIDVVRAHLEPRPRVREGQIISRAGVATSMIDVSDGLAADLGHICDASGVGVEIDEARVPFDAVLTKIAKMAGKKLRQYMLYGGEDYELLFTVRPDSAESLERLADSEGFTLHRIGKILRADEGRVLIDPQGGRHELDAQGWDHFGTR